MSESMSPGETEDASARTTRAGISDRGAEAANPAQQRRLREAHTGSSDASPAGLVLASAKHHSGVGALEDDLRVPSVVVGCQASATVRLKWKNFVRDAAEELARHCEEASQVDHVGVQRAANNGENLLGVEGRPVVGDLELAGPANDSRDDVLVGERPAEKTASEAYVADVGLEGVAVLEVAGERVR
jgi:hypothetical protein